MGRSVEVLAKLAVFVRRLHADTSGENGVGVILLLAAVTIPLVVVIAAFGADISNYLSNEVNRLQPGVAGR